MPTRRIALLLAVLTAALAACGGDEAAEGTVSTPEYLAFRDQPTACGAEQPPPARDLRFDGPDDLGLEGVVVVVLDTSCGRITMELDTALAPATVNSFVFLAEQGYFDGIALHRVVPGYVVQIGDPTATGSGSPGYAIPDELPAADFLYTRGVVAMANAGRPGTAGSQFFVMIEDAPLPPSYAVFGRVTGGMEVVDAMAGVPMGPNPGDFQPSRPLETIYVNGVEVIGR